MAQQGNREGGALRLGPRPVEFLRQALRLRKVRVGDGRPTEGAEAGVKVASFIAAGLVPTAALKEFPSEQFPSPMNATSDLPISSTMNQPVRSGDDIKPRGPGVDELEMVLAAMKQRNTARRAQWRSRNLDLCKERERELLDGEGRVNEAKPETYEGYVHRGLGLIGRYKHELNIRASIEDIDPRIFANWVLASKFASKRGTWRNYRQAAAAVVRTIPSVHAEEAIGMLNADVQLGAGEGRSRRSKAHEASGGSAQRMEHTHFLSLKRAILDQRSSKASIALGYWLEAGLRTGLRPMEWELAFIEKSPREHGFRTWLHVVAARGDDGKPAYRSLDISAFGDEAQEAVERMVALSRTWTSSGQFAVWQREVAKKLRATCEKLFPRMVLPYTLGSLRSQFIANMVSVYSREQVAAMADYVATGEKAEHYRKRRPYWRKSEISELPIPVAEQVARIETRLRLLDQILEVQSMKEVVRRRKR
jgi:hypothetical protein